MKVLVTGASGFIGSHLSRLLHAAGHTVLPVGRGPQARYTWSAESLARGVAEADAVIHLAGENLVGKRWTAKQKEILISSRVENTANLSRLIAQRKLPVFVSASAIGYYGANTSAVFDESSAQGSGFLADLCAQWEAATDAAVRGGVRRAIVRIGMAVGPDGGALKKMLLPFKLGLGGPLGNGRQWVSWIHVDDLAAVFLFILEHPEVSGIFNGTAPQPVTMGEFAKALGRALHRPAIFPVPAAILQIALGEVSEVLLTGQKVLPRRTLDAGFHFRFPTVDEALSAATQRAA